MDHNQAVENRAVERYLLQDMTQEERDEFEEHYFGCAECAQDLRAGARFRAGARGLLVATAQSAVAAYERRRRGSWWSYPSLIPVGVSICLLGIVLYQYRNQPLPGVQPVIAVGLHDTVRGGEGPARIPPGGNFFTVYFDIPPSPGLARYESVIADFQGKTVAQLSGPVPKPGEPVNLLLSRDNFPTGEYAITVRGDAKSVLLQLKFIVE
jgi:hypothetical protein